MKNRILAAGLASGATGAAALLMLMPWLNPCASAHELVVCDFFPSVSGSVARQVTQAAVVIACGALGAYLSRQRPALSGAAAAGVQYVAALALYPLLFVSRGSDTDSFATTVFFAIGAATMALGAVGGLTFHWIAMSTKQPNKLLKSRRA